MPGHAAFEVRLEGADVVSVGRAEDNVIPLRDMNVSRHHFAVESRPPLGWVLRDKNSRNGTLVNGVSCMDKVLGEGDRIQVGGSTLTYHAQASPHAQPLPNAPPPVVATPRTTIPLPARPPVGGQTMKMPEPQPRGRAITPPAMVRPTLAQRPAAATASPSSSGEGVASGFGTVPAAVAYSGPAAGVREGGSGVRDSGPAPGATPPPAFRPGRESQRWRKLAEVACAINIEHETDRLLERILDAVLALVPSKSACLVLLEESELQVKVLRNASHATLDDQTGENRVSRQVCREAIAQRRPVLTQDAASDQRLGQSESIMNMRLRSILCVPFSNQEDVLGVVYLDEPKVDPFADNGEVVELVAAFGDMAGIALANARMMEQIAQRERLEEELRIAGRIQMKLLPSAAPAVQGLEVAGRTVPARHVGGDIYDFVLRDLPHKELLVSIGDVSGKGIGAGLVMSTTRSLLRAYAEVHDRTDEMLIDLNRHLSRDLEPGLFVSLLLLRYEEPTGRLAYSGAGHEHLVFVRPSTRQLELLRTGGVVLGLAPDLRGRVQERQILLQPGDVVVLYTDGATEARSPSGEELGLDRLCQAIQAGPLDPPALVERLIQTVLDFTGAGRELADDLTIVALRKS